MGITNELKMRLIFDEFEVQIHKHTSRDQSISYTATVYRKEKSVLSFVRTLSNDDGIELIFMITEYTQRYSLVPNQCQIIYDN